MSQIALALGGAGARHAALPSLPASACAQAAATEECVLVHTTESPIVSISFTRLADPVESEYAHLHLATSRQNVAHTTIGLSLTQTARAICRTRLRSAALLVVVARRCALATAVAHCVGARPRSRPRARPRVRTATCARLGRRDTTRVCRDCGRLARVDTAGGHFGPSVHACVCCDRRTRRRRLANWRASAVLPLDKC